MLPLTSSRMECKSQHVVAHPHFPWKLEPIWGTRSHELAEDGQTISGTFGSLVQHHGKRGRAMESKNVHSLLECRVQAKTGRTSIMNTKPRKSRARHFSFCCFFPVAGPGWALPRSRNGHGFHRIPALPSSKLDEQLPTTFSCCHHLRHAPAHPCIRMIRLLEEGGLDLFQICWLHRSHLMDKKPAVRR